MKVKEISKIVNNQRIIVKKPELLAPAGDLEKLKIAIRYGADAVFIGGKEFSLRARASNFSIDDIKEGVDFAKSYGAKVFVTTNIIAHNENLFHLEEYLTDLYQAGVTAVICADPFIIKTAKRVVPELEVHLSTQQSITNSEAVNFWAEEGVKRVVLARELTLEEIDQIMKKTKADIEVFIHGGMCSSYSGRCTLSNNMTDRDANRGGCAHSCRWNYRLYNEEHHQLSSDDVAYSFSSKDLMSVRQIPALIESGVDSFKIEGRMKSIHYIATVVGTYRKLIDDYCANPDQFELGHRYLDEMAKAENRLTAEGFFNGPVTENEQLYNMRSEQPTQEFIALVLDYDQETQMATVEQRNYFTKGDYIEVYGPGFKHEYHTIDAMYDKDLNEIDVARHPRQVIKLKLPFVVNPYDLIRKARNKE
jgi:U32 family peptidase